MKISQNNSQRLTVILLMTLDSYRILIGSFYSIFVPQICPDKPTHSFNGTNYYGHYNSTELSYHACTLEDNVTDLTDFNKFVLAFNAFTALLMLIAFIVEFRRENWIINHLDVDATKPDSNLRVEIEGYTKMKKSITSKNVRYLTIFISVGIVSLINCAVSAALIAFYFDGLKTVTTFLTNTLLIGMRIVKSINVARTCQLEMKAQSVNLSEPTTFNTIDTKYRIHPETTEHKISEQNPMVPLTLKVKTTPNGVVLI
jgi:hypothetical protein